MSSSFLPSTRVSRRLMTTTPRRSPPNLTPPSAAVSSPPPRTSSWTSMLRRHRVWRVQNLHRGFAILKNSAVSLGSAPMRAPQPTMSRSGGGLSACAAVNDACVTSAMSFTLPQQRHVLVKEHAPPMLHAPHHEPTLGVRVDDRGPARAHQVEILHGVGRVSPTRQHGRRPTAPSKRERASASRTRVSALIADEPRAGCISRPLHRKPRRSSRSLGKAASAGRTPVRRGARAQSTPTRAQAARTDHGASPDPRTLVRGDPRAARIPRAFARSRYRLFSFLLPDAAALTGSTRRSPAFVSPGQEEEAERGGEGRQGCGEGGQGGGETTQG